MPAVPLNQIQAQIAELSWKYTRAPEYVEGLRDLFNQYGSLVFKKGQVTRKLRAYPSFHVPPVLMNQLEMSLIANHRRYPQASLALVDALWQEEMIEPKTLAAALLGRVDAGGPEPIMQRILLWCQPDLHPLVQEVVFDHATLTLRERYAAVWLAQIEAWADHPTQTIQNMGLRAMLPLAKDRQFNNLPPLFRLLTPLVQSFTPDQQPVLAELLTALVRRTPVEMSFLLRQICQRGVSSASLRMLRRLLPIFPPHEQEQLRQAIKDASPTS